MSGEKMIILDSYTSTGSNPKAEQSFGKNRLLGSQLTDDKTLSFKQDVCMLDDGIRLLREGGKVYIFRYR